MPPPPPERSAPPPGSAVTKTLRTENYQNQTSSTACTFCAACTFYGMYVLRAPNGTTQRCDSFTATHDVRREATMHRWGDKSIRGLVTIPARTCHSMRGVQMRAIMAFRGLSDRTASRMCATWRQPRRQQLHECAVRHQGHAVRDST